MQGYQATRRVERERRKQNRYRLAVPVLFTWRKARQAEVESLGLTRELSTRSAFVLTAVPPPLGADVEFKAFFPPLAGSAAAMRIHGEGRVVRVEAFKRHKGRAGFAVVGKPFVFRRGREWR